MTEPNTLDEQISTIYRNRNKYSSEKEFAAKLKTLFTEHSKANLENIEDWVDRGLKSENKEVWYRCLQMIAAQLKRNK